MKNRFTKIFTAILSAALAASTVSGITVSGETESELNDCGMTINRTEIDAISLNLRGDRDIMHHSVESKKVTLDCEISSDADGYIYVNFSTQNPEDIEDIEIPVSFFDRIENATSNPCYINTPYGYEYFETGTSGELVDDEDCMEQWIQIIRKDDKVHKVDGEICSMRFAYSPMNAWKGYQEIPVITYYKLREHPAKGDSGNFFEMYEEWEMYADMPEINISYLKEMERKINEYNSKIDELESQIALLQMNSLPNPDFNGDGRVSIADAVCLMKYIVGVDSV